MTDDRPEESAPEAGPLEGESPVEKDFTTLVATRKRFLGFSLAGAGFLGLIAVILLSGPKKEKKNSDSVPETVEAPNSSSVSSPPASAPRIPIVMPPPEAETEILPRHHHGSDERALVALRRTSPILIFNAPSSHAAGAEKGGTGISNGPAGSASAGSAFAGSAPAGTAPLPRGFSPSAAASAHSTQIGDRSWIMAQGKLIDAVLESAINSDHPGLLRALVSDDTYGDSGERVLLPRGSRLIGEYDSGIVQGQNRVFVLWQRAIRPDGVDIQLMSAATDALGRTGIEGGVHRHFLTMFGVATLLSVIGAGAANVGASPGDNANSIAAYREGVAKSFSDTANTVLGEFVKIKPTITVRPGERIKVFVSRDLYFDAGIPDGAGVQRIP